ncbi:MAG: hypothetical protein ACE5I1_19760 [bacterium]
MKFQKMTVTFFCLLVFFYACSSSKSAKMDNQTNETKQASMLNFALADSDSLKRNADVLQENRLYEFTTLKIDSAMVENASVCKTDSTKCIAPKTTDACKKSVKICTQQQKKDILWQFDTGG